MVKNLRKLREERGLTQQRLAELTGISKSRIYSYESKEREPDIAGLITLADFFSVSIDYLVGKEADFYMQKNEAALDLDKFGERIRCFRIQRQMKVEELASKSGIKANYLSLIESGAKKPSFDTLIQLLNALEVSADAVLMDSLLNSNGQKTCYLSLLTEQLSPKDRKYVLDSAEAIAERLKRKMQRDE